MAGPRTAPANGLTGRQRVVVAEDLAVDVTRLMDAVREEIAAIMLEGVQKSASFCASMCAKRIVDARREFLQKCAEERREPDRRKGSQGAHLRSPISSSWSPATTIAPVGGLSPPLAVPALMGPNGCLRPAATLNGAQPQRPALPATWAGEQLPTAALSGAAAPPTVVHQPQALEYDSKAAAAFTYDTAIVDACEAVHTLEVRTHMAAQAMDLLDEALRAASSISPVSRANSSCGSEAALPVCAQAGDVDCRASCSPEGPHRPVLPEPSDAADRAASLGGDCGDKDPCADAVLQQPLDADVVPAVDADLVSAPPPALRSVDRLHFAPCSRTVAISPDVPERVNGPEAEAGQDLRTLEVQDDGMCLSEGEPVAAMPTFASRPQDLERRAAEVAAVSSSAAPPQDLEGRAAEALGPEGGDAPAVPRAPRSELRRFCAEGTRCRRRDAKHLAAQAHPFDGDYVCACRAAGCEPEELSLWGLFSWVDLFSTGRASRPELDTGLRLLAQLRAHEEAAASNEREKSPPVQTYPRFTDETWEELDVHDAGTLTFNEFAGWAGPRLGLPLGVSHLFSKEDLHGVHACGVVGCPCEGFRGQQPKGPCAGGCGFARTWHPTHCCFACKRGTGSHGRKCGKIPARFAAQWAAEDDSRLGKGEGADEAGKPGEPGYNGLRLCLCGHKRSAHAQRFPTCGEVPLPPYWSRTPTHEKRAELVELTLGECEILQSLLDITHRRVWTRDRRKHSPSAPDVPQGYRLIRAFRAENVASWQKYCVRRRLLQDSLAEDSTGSFTVYDDVLSTAAWAACAASASDRLATRINEWYLWHGTNFAAASSICRGDFRVQQAGERTGTLYGRGVYCAESITKSDEYAVPNEDGEYTVLLCRALGGRVRYTGEEAPDQEELLRDCIEGPYSCVLGDRVRCRGTFREFVFFDTEHLYAEYLIQYTRRA